MGEFDPVGERGMGRQAVARPSYSARVAFGDPSEPLAPTLPWRGRVGALARRGGVTKHGTITADADAMPRHPHPVALPPLRSSGGDRPPPSRGRWAAGLGQRVICTPRQDASPSESVAGKSLLF